MKKNNEFRKNDKNNPWTKEDEGSHYPIQKEWWCLETIFKTIKDNRKWNLKASLAYQLETPSCFFIYFLFDITNNRCVYHKALNDDINKFKFKKNRVDLSYEKTKITGLYPDYHIHIQDDEKGFIADFDYHAKILPHWSVQDITNGFLPIGLDHYRYGWLLNCDLKGSLKIKDEYKIKGKGYLERAYGNWSYSNPFIRKSNFKKTFSIYNKLVFNWLSQKKIKIPNKISFTTENNPIGYDWFWGIFDNDWSVFYGNSLFWVRQGPGLGVLTLITDDNKYIDFMDYDFKYNKTIFLKKYDVEYPTDLTINAYYKEKKLTMRAYATCDPKEYIDEFPGNGFYKAFIMPEMPGKITGEFNDGEKKINLSGDCKIVHQRQPSKLGHNSLTFKFNKPPKGVGISMDFDSHFLKKKIFTKINLAPKPSMKFKINKKK